MVVLAIWRKEKKEGEKAKFSTHLISSMSKQQYRTTFVADYLKTTNKLLTKNRIQKNIFWCGCKQNVTLGSEIVCL